jgi:hypothetical protein
MARRLLTLMSAAVLLASSGVPSLADHHGGGGNWHGGAGGWHAVDGNWHGGSWHHGGHGGGWGVGPAIGLGLGLGLLGGALATAPYYTGYNYGYAPYAGTPGPTVWYWCDPYQGYYPAVPECPVPWRQVVQ